VREGMAPVVGFSLSFPVCSPPVHRHLCCTVCTSRIGLVCLVPMAVGDEAERKRLGLSKGQLAQTLQTWSSPRCGRVTGVGGSGRSSARGQPEQVQPQVEAAAMVQREEEEGWSGGLTSEWHPQPSDQTDMSSRSE